MSGVSPPVRETGCAVWRLAALVESGETSPPAGVHHVHILRMKGLHVVVTMVLLLGLVTSQAAASEQRQRDPR